MAIGSWIEADHQINGYLAPDFVRYNHTLELDSCDVASVTKILIKQIEIIKISFIINSIHI